MKNDMVLLWLLWSGILGIRGGEERLGIAAVRKEGDDETGQEEEPLVRMVPVQTERVNGRTAAENAMMESHAMNLFEYREQYVI